MLIYSLSCSYSNNLSSFRFIIKQQWTFEEISIFSNSSHLEWRVGLSETFLKGTHPWTIPARFGLIWFRGFKGEDLNVKVYDGWRRTSSDGKSSHGLWPGELKKRKKSIFVPAIGAPMTAATPWNRINNPKVLVRRCNPNNSTTTIDLNARKAAAK